MSVAELVNIAKYFQYPLGKISFTDDKVMQMEVNKNKKLQKLVGFSTILNFIHNELSNGREIDVVEHYLSKQFFDFSFLFLNFTCKKDKFAACLELNEFLSRRSYILGQQISIVDLVVFYAMKNVMKQFSTHDKENFVNLSRYYDHIQQLDNVRSDEAVNFLTLHL